MFSYVFLSLSVFAITLPGRESRAKEPFFQSMQQIVDEIIGVLLPLLKEKPFALFGHRYKNHKNQNQLYFANQVCANREF